jgi:hypothetical protein
MFYNYYGMLVAGNIFEDCGFITHLGIQAKPGTKFYLNNSDFPITVGFTGIYELELEKYGHIYAIRFDRSSIDKYDNAGNTDRLLIDIIYEGGK